MKVQLMFLLGLMSVIVRGSGSGLESVQQRCERMARTYTNFSRAAVIYNRPLRLWPSAEQLKPPTGERQYLSNRTNALAAEQFRLLQELRALSEDKASMAALLESSDPKVRTLALGAIFQREDGRDLPLIARLVEDSAPTFPDLHESPNSAPGPRPISELVSSQTVGDVAQAMLVFWGVPVTYPGARGTADRPTKPGISSKEFAQYWSKYRTREYSASWFMVKMNRATRQTTPIQSKYRADIQRVLAEMRALPMPDRAWIELYVLAPPGWLDLEPEARVATDEELLAMAKTLGPELLMRFLQRSRISEDPDLQMNGANLVFSRISNFVLRHANQLLRPEDGDALLALEAQVPGGSELNPAWSIGAALLQPAMADDILRRRLERQTAEFGTAAAHLAGALWRIVGPSETEFLVNWFYANNATLFLHEVLAAQHPETGRLMSALAKDGRFTYTDWETLKDMLLIVNAGRSRPLVDPQNIYAAQPNGLQDQRLVLPAWRDLLRREYGVPEKPPPPPAATPGRILTQPAWSVSLADEPPQIAISPDGEWLAVLTNRIITTWNANKGLFSRQIPRPPVGWTYCLAFQAEGRRLAVFDGTAYGSFSQWDLSTYQQVGQFQVSGKPANVNLDLGAHCFDGGAFRAAFSGFSGVACLDARSGVILWLNGTEGGVGSVVALSADGSRLAVGGGNRYPKAVRLYEAGSGIFLRQFERHASPVVGVALSADGSRLVSATAADGLQLLDTTTGELLRAYAYWVPSWGMGTPVFSPDGKLVAAVRAATRVGEGHVGVFLVDSGELKWEIQLVPGAMIGPRIALAFAPNGKLLYTAAGRLEAWPLER